jgi:hypothetical protein
MLAEIKTGKVHYEYILVCWVKVWISDLNIDPRVSLSDVCQTMLISFWVDGQCDLIF